MKSGWAVLLLFAAGLTPLRARGQAGSHSGGNAAMYGTFTYTDFGNYLGVENLFGGTLGLTYDVAPIGRHVVLAADVQGRFVRNNYDTLEGINVGPRFSVPLKSGYTPYAEFMIGFDRFSFSPGYVATTDNSLQVNGGIAKQLTPRFDVVADYSYARYFAMMGLDVPKSISVGAVYHFVKRDMPERRVAKQKGGALPTATHPIPPKTPVVE